MKILPPTIEQLVWDDWNREHIRKHDVTRAEVEEAVGANTHYSATYKDRVLATGSTLAGRMLTVVIGESPDVSDHWYVFSARPASRKERARFDQVMKKGDFH